MDEARIKCQWTFPPPAPPDRNSRENTRDALGERLSPGAKISPNVAANLKKTHAGNRRPCS
jgi:hypothetical protein